MARYILVAVDDNKRAATLIERLKTLAGVEIVGLFPKPTKFCECTGPHAKGPNSWSVLGRRFGWHNCSECRLPRKGSQTYMKNLLNEADLPIEFNTCWVHVREPWSDPVTLYGREVIDRKKAQIAHSAAKWGDEHKQRKRRLARERRKKARAAAKDKARGL